MGAMSANAVLASTTGRLPTSVLCRPIPPNVALEQVTQRFSFWEGGDRQWITRSVSNRSFEDELSYVWLWFKGWSDKQKDIMMNALEQCDQRSTYAFLDTVAKFRWK